MTLRDILLSFRHILFPIFLGLPPEACNVTALFAGGTLTHLHRPITEQQE